MTEKTERMRKQRVSGRDGRLEKFYAAFWSLGTILMFILFYVFFYVNMV